MKTTVWFMMTKGDEPEKVIFQGSLSYNEIDEFFEEKCGGVYRWWILTPYNYEITHVNLNEPQNPALSKNDVMPRELSLHNYWDSNTSEDRVEIVERAFKMIEKQKEYIAVLNEELNGLIGMASVHGWKSNLVEQGKKLRDEMALLQGHNVCSYAPVGKRNY